MQTIRHAPPNSIVFVSDTDGGAVPNPLHWSRDPINASSSCVCIGCYLEMYGETEFTLAATADISVGPEFHLAFDGEIDTPNKEVMVSDIDVDGLLRAAVPSEKTRIRVWLNDRKLADRVIIGWG